MIDSWDDANRESAGISEHLSDPLQRKNGKKANPASSLDALIFFRACRY
jgi:hypothetical protein